MSSHASVRRMVAAPVLVAAAVSASAAFALASEPPAATAVDDVRGATPSAGYFPDVNLVTQDGRRVRFYSDLLRGKVVLINFIFTRCKELCPRTTTNMRRVQELLGNEIGRTVHIISITVDPDNDTPAVLKAYAEAAGAGRGWEFLTGDTEDIESIRRKLGVFDREEDDNPMLHTGMLVYGNERTGKWRGVYVMAKPEVIARSVLKLIDEASMK